MSIFDNDPRKKQDAKAEKLRELTILDALKESDVMIDGQCRSCIAQGSAARTSSSDPPIVQANYE